MILINQFPRTLSPATQSQNGLLEASDKIRIDNMYVLNSNASEPTSSDEKIIWIGGE